MSDEQPVEEWQARFAIESLRAELHAAREFWESLGREFQQTRQFLRGWMATALGVMLLVAVPLTTVSSVIGLKALIENTRTLRLLGDLAVGNRELVGVIQADLKLLQQRLEIQNRQLDLIERQMEARDGRR